MKKLKVYTIYSDSHRILFEEYFVPSLKNTDLELHAYKTKQFGSGEFGTHNFAKAVLDKINIIIRAVEENDGDIFIYSDVDIIFFKKISYDLRKRMWDKDILFQSEFYYKHKHNHCTGFFVCKSNKRTLILWKTCRERLQESILRGDDLNDQDIVNRVLNEWILKIEKGFLPLDLYNNPRKFVSNPYHPPLPPKSIFMYHANHILWVRNKLILLQKIKDIIESGDGIWWYRWRVHVVYRMLVQIIKKYIHDII